MRFYNKEACLSAIKEFHIANHVDFKVLTSNETYFIAKCVIDGYAWRCRATVERYNSFWSYKHYRQTINIHCLRKHIFHRLFWSFKPCINGFEYYKPIFQLNGAWLYKKYRGTLLIAMEQDGNNFIFPIAFAIVEGDC
uniref:Uncharacterized protein n=1 Tax=Cajanus cajan TaxID=3821 RepID=A0A151U8M8_CAJCA|nr:hypothetical protein KK1_019810 [Cajanus cajan]